MKNALKFLPVLFLSGAFTLAQAQTAPTSKPMSGKMEKGQMAMNGCTMKDGKMMMMKDGKMMPMTGNMTMSDGTTCMADGTCKMKNGKSMKMKDGQCMMMDGKMTNMDQMKKTGMMKSDKMGGMKM